MLTIDHLARRGSSITRRSFLEVGTFALGGLTLAELLRQQAAARCFDIVGVRPDRDHVHRSQGNLQTVKGRRPTRWNASVRAA